MKQLLVIDGLTCRINGSTILNDLSLSLDEGSVTCLMAPSGWGKTTLLRAILGLCTPQTGRISLLTRLQISCVFQEDRLLPTLTGIQNVLAFVPQADPEAVREAFRKAGFHEDDMAKPASALSGGMCRRVAILRALFAPHQLLLLDEPMKGLDADTKALMAALILSNHSHTILMTSHSEEDASIMQASILRPDSTGHLIRC